MSETLKVQISRAVQFWLDGTHVGQCPNRLDEHGYGWEGQNLIRKIDEAPRTRKDGTVTVHLLPQEAVALADLADTMHQTNLDEFSTFGEARAGASLVEKLRVLGVNVPPMRYEFGTDPNPYDGGSDDGGDDGSGGPGGLDGPDSPSPWCPTCGCPDGWRPDGPRAVRGGHGCSRGDECPDCPTNAERYRRYLEQTRVDVESCNNCDAVGPVVADDPRGYCAACIADTDDQPEVMFYEQDLDADDRLVLQPHHDRIVVKNRGDVYLALPWSTRESLPSGTSLVISIRDSSSTDTVRTTRPIDELSWLIAEALDRAETMGRYPHADEIGIYVEDVVTIAG